MGFWSNLMGNSSSAKYKEDAPFLSEVKKAVGSTTNTVIEKSMWGVRKFYDLKIQMVNYVSDIEPEWGFYDRASQLNKIHVIENELTELENQKIKASTELEALYCKKNDLIKEMDKLSKEINGSTSNVGFKRDRLIDVIAKAENVDVEINETKNIYNNTKSKIKQCLEKLILEESVLMDNIPKCINMANEYEIDSNFIDKGLECLLNFANGDLEQAKFCAGAYYEHSDKNPCNCKQPWLAYNIARYLVDVNAEQALEYMELPIKHYPQNIELHQFVCYVHNKMGQCAKADFEKEIIALLS